jgi:ankyrin repeat protein
MTKPAVAACLAVLAFTLSLPAGAQTPPDASELATYTGLHAAAARGDAPAIERLVNDGADMDVRDSNRRTPLHVAAFTKQDAAAVKLMSLGADPNALDGQRYDIVTIASVADDVPMLRTALKGGGKATNITSPYDGTALIAAAHLGHDEVVRTLIAAGAPLDHVNNLGWTALIESIVLGDGGKRHIACLEALVQAGANVNVADRSGATPLTLAKRRGYAEMVAILDKAGAR